MVRSEYTDADYHPDVLPDRYSDEHTDNDANSDTYNDINCYTDSNSDPHHYSSQHQILEPNIWQQLEHRRELVTERRADIYRHGVLRLGIQHSKLHD